MLKKCLNNVNLWFEYNDTYIQMHKQGKINNVTAKTEGCKFMRKGWNIVLIIILLLSLLDRVL